MSFWKKKNKISLITLISFTIFGFFYWFQIRPAQIKHDCSWIEVHEKAIPASLGVTVEEVEASKKDHPECKGLTLSVPRSGYPSIFQNVEGSFSSRIPILPA